MRSGVKWTLVLLTVLYPVAVYAALGRVAPQWMALLLAALAVARALVARERWWWVVAAGTVLLAVAAWISQSPLMVKLYPVLVNGVLLGVFGASLWQPPSVVERLARLREPDLPPSGVRYTRQVTKVWCVFFVLNGSIAAITALYGSDAVWALYNGLIAYVLMGCLMAAEWCVRRSVRRAEPPPSASA
ncbi:hypothetical protein [Diaphorobacter sp.]|uniref:COG4648 family protein n=1 Tax=Diaphorobacter sp. TaxID=1934310 RepID=UPI003917FF4E